jgi:hypothetical protein
LHDGIWSVIVSVERRLPMAEKGKVIKFIGKHVRQMLGKEMMSVSFNILKSDFIKIRTLAVKRRKPVGDEIRNAISQYLKQSEE